MNNIVLTGFMGVGKTTIGRQLAKRLGVEFFDIDELIEKDEGRSIVEIFEQSGEDYFRRKEFEVFRSLIDKNSGVISTGGGTFENADVQRLAKERAVSVCLVSSMQGLLKRTNQLKKRRPMLRDKTVDEIRALYAEREKCYAGCDLFVEVEGLKRSDVVAEILELLKRQ